MASNLAVGDRVIYINARSQASEKGVVVSLGDRLPDGTIIAYVKRDEGGTIQLPVAGLSRA